MSDYDWSYESFIKECKVYFGDPSDGLLIAIFDYLKKSVSKYDLKQTFDRLVISREQYKGFPDVKSIAMIQSDIRREGLSYSQKHKETGMTKFDFEKLQGDGTFKREMENASKMYGSVKGYLQAFLEIRKTEPYIKSETFMRKSLMSYEVMNNKNA